MADLPEPLTPADCDLRDFAFMPLDVVRLRDSDLAIHVTGEEFRCAVLLWCASWHQVPAGSLPDDDKALSSLAGYGRAIGEWQRHREGAMRGWIKCSDGRLYHPVVAEKAHEGWVAKLRQRWSTECARIKKHNQRHGTHIRQPDFDEWMSQGCPQGQVLHVPGDNDDINGGQQSSVPGDNDGASTGTDASCPASVPREKHSKGQGDRQGYISPAPASPAHDAPARDRDPRERFALPEDWEPSPEFPAQLIRAGLDPERYLTAEHLAEFIAYRRAEDTTARTQQGWEHKLMQTLIAIRDRANTGGPHHAAQNRPGNSQRLTAFQRLTAANPLGGRAAPAAGGGRVIDAEPD